MGRRKLSTTAARPERTYLVGVQIKRRRSAWSLNDSLNELAELTRSSGGEVIRILSQRLDKPTQTYIGKGKLQQLIELAAGGRFDTLVCDDELSASQILHRENLQNVFCAYALEVREIQGEFTPEHFWEEFSGCDIETEISEEGVLTRWRGSDTVLELVPAGESGAFRYAGKVDGFTISPKRWIEESI